jgi:peptide/nickel transport system substrate-binding protein
MNFVQKHFGTLMLTACGLLLNVAPGVAPVAQAANLRIGLAAEVSTLDPHYLNIAPNVAFSSHLFDALVHTDQDGKLIPALATSWKPIDATTWELKLRPGVKFHDGSAFTAEDAVYSLERPALLKNSPGPFTSYTRQIVGKQVVDSHTLRLKTATPYGPLPLDLSTIFIVSKKAAANASTEDFNSGKALIGTGPFKFASFRPGDSIELTRNDAYWGPKAAFEKASFRMITNDASRLAALLAGDVDAIENVPTADLSRVKSQNKFTLAQRTSWRTIFWHMDQASQSARYITDKAGKPLPNNPLRDPRVREALSKAINRQALSERIMEGLALPASNIVSPGILGHDASLKPDAYDVAAAKKLLADAGYPNGFAITLHGPKNRYINDEKVVQAVAQFFTRVGVQAKVETLPLSVYFARAKTGEFSMALLGWGTLAADFGLRTLVGTPNPDTGWGSWNWGKYSNKTVDELVASSLGSVDEAKRADFARQAMAAAMKDRAVLPLHHQTATWAMRRGLKYNARIDEFTFAHQFSPE